MGRRAPLVEHVAWLAALAACRFDLPEGALLDAPAGPGDAADARPAFDPATGCPATYTTSLPSTASTSRYRVITALATFWPHSVACNADRPGVTHAASVGTMQELLELDAHVDSLAMGERYYLGGVQDPQATAPSQGWIWFDGTPLLQTAWHTAEGEPNDNNSMGIETHGQQLLVFDRNLSYLHDAIGNVTYGIVCECDGTPVAAIAQDFVDRDPNNPN